MDTTTPPDTKADSTLLSLISSIQSPPESKTSWSSFGFPEHQIAFQPQHLPLYNQQLNSSFSSYLNSAYPAPQLCPLESTQRSYRWNEQFLCNIQAPQMNDNVVMNLCASGAQLATTPLDSTTNSHTPFIIKNIGYRSNKQNKSGKVVKKSKSTDEIKKQDSINIKRMPSDVSQTSQSSTLSSDFNDQETKREKNRQASLTIAAQECRKKKREYVEQLRNQVKMLESKNLSLTEVAKMAEKRAQDIESVAMTLSQRNRELELKVLQQTFRNN